MMREQWAKKKTKIVEFVENNVCRPSCDTVLAPVVVFKFNKTFGGVICWVMRGCLCCEDINCKNGR